MRRFRVPALALAAALLLGGCGGGSGGSGGSGSSGGSGGSGGSGAAADGPTLPTGPVWPAPTTGVSARAEAAGLGLLTREAFAQHIHAHLDVYVNGAKVVVPANIGIDYVARRITPLHTHDSSGIIHIESPDQRSYSLGQFFAEWGVRLDAQCVQAYCAPAVPTTVQVNGTAVAGDPASIVIHLHDEIAVVVGTAPPQVPTRYAFPRGY